jgi:hypothetical protein
MALTIAAGLASEEVLILPTFVLTGVLGALVASRTPSNPIGWLMCGSALYGIVLFAPLDYGYKAQVTMHGSWPLGGVALWLGSWTWAPLVGLFLPLMTVRFPDGRTPPRWRAVEWLAAAGTAIFAVGVALSPPSIVVRFLLISTVLRPVITPQIANPLGTPLSSDVSAVVIYAGITMVLVAYAASVASVVDRSRRARGDERQQLKWFGYAGVIIAVASVYAAAIGAVGFVPSEDIAIAIHVSFLALPVSIAIAILRYRLYDIDLIINRTLVYGGLTAILGAVYAAVITLLNRLFISISGQRSDAAYVVTAFVVVFASAPVKDWLQRQVDRRVPHASPAMVLERFRQDVDAVVSVIDVHRVARRLVDQAIDAFDARGAALYLHSIDGSNPMYERGRLNGEAQVEVFLRHEDHELGRLVLAGRHGGVAYTEHDRAVLQRSADSVGEALALAAHLGFKPLTRAH